MQTDFSRLRALIALGIPLTLGGCGEAVVDHVRPCPSNIVYSDVVSEEIGSDPNRVEGLRGVTEVVGDLQLSGEFDSLAALSCLERVHGTLSITHAPIESLAGLDRLAQVGRLDLSTLPNLRDVDALTSLHTIDEGLVLMGLPAVEDLLGFSGLTDLRGDVRMYDVSPDAELSLPLGEEYEGNLGLEGEIPSLASSTANLQRLRGHAYLAGRAVAAVDFSSLARIDGVLSVQVDGAPEPLPTMPVLTHVGGPVSIRNVSDEDLSSMSAITQLGELSVSDCDSLQSLHGLEGLTDIISEVPLGEVGTAGGSVLLYGNPVLTDVSALANVEVMRDSMGGLGGLSIRENPVLADLTGTASLVELSLFVSVSDLPALRDLTGWEGLAAIRSLNIATTGLQTLGGFSLAPNAQLGDESLFIGLTDNPELTDIEPFIPVPGQTISSDGLIVVEHSPMLSGCQVERLQAEAQALGFAGEVVAEGLLDDGPC